MKVGIVSYGAYIPIFRIEAKEIAQVWGADGESVSQSLGVFSKSVPGPDEDVITMSVEAARYALKRCKVDPTKIGAIYVGSESHPYAVKPTATIVAEAIGATPDLTAADLEFACKAGTAGIQMAMGLVGAGMVSHAMAIGCDTAQGAPGDALEYSASAGGAAFLIGKEDIIAELGQTCSYTTDTPDFWRREGQRYPSHGGRFTGVPAYFKHVVNCGKRLLELAGTKPSDYKYAIFHQPNGKFPVRAAKMLGFTKEQIDVGLLCPQIGNTYSGAVPLGLSAVLDEARPHDRIFVVAYGSGAGADAFDITVTDGIGKLDRSTTPTTKAMVDDRRMLSYAIYAKFRQKIQMGGA